MLEEVLVHRQKGEGERYRLVCIDDRCYDYVREGGGGV